MGLRVALADSSLRRDRGYRRRVFARRARRFRGRCGETPKECSNVHCVASSASTVTTGIVNAFATGGVVSPWRTSGSDGIDPFITPSGNERHLRATAASRSSACMMIPRRHARGMRAFGSWITWRCDGPVQLDLELALVARQHDIGDLVKQRPHPPIAAFGDAT